MINFLITAFLFFPTFAAAQITHAPDGTIYFHGGGQTMTSDGDIVTPLGGNYGIGMSGRIYLNPPAANSSTSSRQRDLSNYDYPDSSYGYDNHAQQSRSRPSDSRFTRKRPPQSAGFARNLEAKPQPGAYCYCGSIRGQCFMKRLGDERHLEGVDNYCTVQVCTFHMKWSLENICQGKWRPYISNTRSPNNDDDKDGVPNFFDLCPKTRIGSKVAVSGARTGCAKDDRLTLVNF